LLAVPLSLVAESQDTPAEKAKVAAAARDSVIKKAHKGMQDIMDFTGNASVCKTGTAMMCNKARDEQMKALRQMREATKKDLQQSKKDGQRACKFARQAGTSERVAEHERDEKEREAQHMEEQTGKEADKASDRVEHVFAKARAAQRSAKALNLPAVLQTLVAESQDTPAEKAEAATARRDSLIKKAHKGIQDIMDFSGNTSVCQNGTATMCNRARDEQMKTLRQMREATKKDLQQSKQAGQRACKFAMKAGINERVAEHERDENEREAERMEEQIEKEADKASDRVDRVFAEARAAQKSSTNAPSGSYLESLTLIAAPQSLAEESQDAPAEKAKAATEARDSLLKKAHKGIQDIMDFSGNTSMCQNGTATMCNRARDEQMKILRQMREATKKDLQQSKQDAQRACNFARKAGISERVAEHERDENERETERMEEQTEKEADKASDRVDRVFAEAHAARKSSTIALAGIGLPSGSHHSSVVGCIIFSCTLLIAFAVVRRRAPATHPLEQPMLSSTQV
jgi:hypothetical protein